MQQRPVRTKFIVGNWKMNGNLAALDEVAAIAGAAGQYPGVDVALALPATLIAPAVMRGEGLAIGGQDVHHKPSGAHTGCLSAAMLREAGAAFTIVGHSERRADQGETSALVRGKAMAAHAEGLGVILCVGETEVERDAGRAAQVVRGQITESLPDGAAPDWLTLAYEPCWAVGTGRTPTTAQITEIHRIARACLVELIGDGAAAIRILYGGSVTAANAREILSADEVDGALVGGASLVADRFAPIIAAAAQVVSA